MVKYLCHAMIHLEKVKFVYVYHFHNLHGVEI